MTRRRRKRLVLVPRLGPPRNLRPGGAHTTPRTVYRRTQEKAALRREIAAGGFARFRRTDG